MATDTLRRGTTAAAGGATDEARKHSEGTVARTIEHYTAHAPSDWFLWAAGGSIAASLTLQALGRKHDALFVGQWAPTFLILGLYNKIVKVAGSDRVHGG
jgi:hypothetical protein